MALSTSRTVITKSGLTTTQSFDVGGILAGVSNLHTIGYDVVDSNTGTGVTVRSTGNAVFSGVITASKFVGDISEATGAAAGLGTALSQTQTDPLNKIYYTNKVLSISTTTTIDHPATANLAYTQYGDIKIEDGHDLIIKTDDDFKYDILGISTTKLLDTNNFPDGLRGNLIGDVTGNLTGNVTGNVTGNLTGTASTSTNAAIAYAIDSSASLNTSGSITASSFISNSGTTIQRQFKYLTNTSQLTKGGSIGELNTNLRIAFTPKFASSNLLMEFDTSYVSPNSTNLYYCLFYDVTNSAGVSIPAAAGSRVRCHWTKRTSPNDVNDNDHLSMRIVTPANNTTARTYTIHFGSEGATAQFFVSTLSTTGGSTYPMTFIITEIAS